MAFSYRINAESPCDLYFIRLFVFVFVFLFFLLLGDDPCQHG